jgi:hypothetical protein
MTERFAAGETSASESALPASTAAFRLQPTLLLPVAPAPNGLKTTRA